MKLHYKSMLSDGDVAIQQAVRSKGPLRLTDGVPVWPVDEFIAAVMISQADAAKLREMNPDGVIEGQLPKGVSATIGKIK